MCHLQPVSSQFRPLTDPNGEATTMQSLNEDSLLAPDRITNHKSSKKGSKCRSITKTTESQAIVEQTAEPLPETISMNGVDLEDDEDHSEVGKVPFSLNLH